MVTLGDLSVCVFAVHGLNKDQQRDTCARVHVFLHASTSARSEKKKKRVCDC